MEGQWWQEEVVYQIYPKSFCDSNGDGIGDLRGITQKLDYLDGLGVTMLWICPMYQSPMDDNGYDISDYRAIAPEFGTMEDMEELIQRAKERGIKILLDLVINHTSDEHEWFQRALQAPDSPWHDYYIFKKGSRRPNNWRSVFGGSVWERTERGDEYYFHAFGKKQPDLNWENPKLREQLYDMVNWWLDKGIAGFRIDAITFIKKDLSWRDREPDGADGLAACAKASQNQPGIGVFLRELKERTFGPRGCMTVAEAPGVPYEELADYIGKQGYFSMIFDFRYADLDIGPEGEWFKRRQWSVQELKERIMESQMAVQSCGWGANFIENHDQPRAVSKYLGEAQENPKAVKMLGAMYFFLRGVPFLYQGQELGMKNTRRARIEEFHDLSSIDQYSRALEEGYSEKEALAFVNLRSRDNARTPFPWNGERYGGFSQHEPWLAMAEEYPRINAEHQIGRAGSIYEFYREMIRFRQKGPWRDCLIYGEIQPVPSGSQVIAYKRCTERETIYAWFNFSAEAVKERLPGEKLEMIWSNDGLEETKACLERCGVREGELWLPPYQALLLAVEKKEERR